MKHRLGKCLTAICVLTFLLGPAWAVEPATVKDLPEFYVEQERKASPRVREKLAELRVLLKERKLKYTVGVTSAADYPLTSRLGHLSIPNPRAVGERLVIAPDGGSYQIISLGKKPPSPRDNDKSPSKR